MFDQDLKKKFKLRNSLQVNVMTFAYYMSVIMEQILYECDMLAVICLSVCVDTP